jgi:hypothetical protein
MSHLKSAVVIGIVVAAGMMTYFWVAPAYSLLQSIFLYPLSPGLFAGLFFSVNGGNAPVAVLSCWIVDTGLYWFIWTIFSSVYRKMSTRPS